MNQVNLINIIDLFKFFADNHQQIKRYGYGTRPQLERVMADSPMFPMLWSNLNQITYQSENQKTLEFAIIVLDILNQDQSNEQDIQNDAILILEDFIKFLRHNDPSGYFQINFGGAIKIETCSEKFTEYTAGASLTINFDVDVDLQNDCGIPAYNYDLILSPVKYQ